MQSLLKVLHVKILFFLRSLYFSGVIKFLSTVIINSLSIFIPSTLVSSVSGALGHYLGRFPLSPNSTHVSSYLILQLLRHYTRRKSLTQANLFDRSLKLKFCWFRGAKALCSPSIRNCWSDALWLGTPTVGLLHFLHFRFLSVLFSVF